MVLGAFADRFAMPVVEQWSPTNALATDHPMHAGFDPGELLGEADVVLVLDVPVPWVPSRQRPAPGAAVIQIGPDPNFVDLPLRGHPATLAITSAVEPALEALGAALDRRLRNGASRAETEVLERAEHIGRARTRRRCDRDTTRCRGESLRPASVIARGRARSTHRRRRRPPKPGSAAISTGRSRPSSPKVAPGSSTSSDATRR